MNKPKAIVVVPWHNPEQIAAFRKVWNVHPTDKRIVFQQDKDRSGCAVTKNRGVKEAIRRGAETIIVLDDDCYPESQHEIPSLETIRDISNAMIRAIEEPIDRTPRQRPPRKDKLELFIEAHLRALEPQPVRRFVPVTSPRSRGTPYGSLDMMLPVAATMGFWTNIGDRCGVRQLADGAETPMKFHTEPVYQRYFAWSGMNCAFRAEHANWFQFIDVPRFDDIWCGLIAQRHFYDLGYCFALNGPLVKHSRQSNVWQNLKDEAQWLEQNETLWQKIALSEKTDYASLRALLPV